MKEDIKELLRKQYELLAQESENCKSVQELCDLTKTMIDVYSVLSESSFSSVL